VGLAAARGGVELEERVLEVLVDLHDRSLQNKQQENKNRIETMRCEREDKGMVSVDIFRV